MKPPIVTQEQKFIFMEQYEAQRKVMELRAELYSIHKQKGDINEQVNILLAKHKVLEERVGKIQEELQVLQTLL